MVYFFIPNVSIFSLNLPIECFEFAFFEQYKERLDIKLVSSVNPIPKPAF